MNLPDLFNNVSLHTSLPFTSVNVSPSELVYQSESVNFSPPELVYQSESYQKRINDNVPSTGKASANFASMKVCKKVLEQLEAGHSISKEDVQNLGYDLSYQRSSLNKFIKKMYILVDF